MSVRRMPKAKRNAVDDLRGASRLAIEATHGVTGVVEAMHRTIAAGPAVLGRPFATPSGLMIDPVYWGIRTVTGLVGTSIDLALEQVAILLGERAPVAEPTALLAALNGVLGDHLSEGKNPLAIQMTLRHGGGALELNPRALRDALPQATDKLLLMVHGSSMSDLQWSRQGHDHGAALARDLGFTPVYLRYNSGLHISSNGRELAALLESLVSAWPTPMADLTIIGHSMGGLVARSACHFGEAAGHRWRFQLRRLVSLGSPHHGSPLEGGGNWIDLLLGVSRYSAPLARLGKIRSAGVTDMRFGNVLDEDWDGRDRFAHGDTRGLVRLPEAVDCYAIAGTNAQKPAVKLPGDGLVPVDSALGRHPLPERTLAFPESHQWIAFGVGHLDLLSSQAVYEKVRSWLRRSPHP
jgi:pimeloyl-ACP methyl ester carboxylesterase